MGIRKFVALATCAAMTACVTRPESVVATYVSPTSYQSWTCQQLGDDKARVSAELVRITALQQENADWDAGLVAAGLIVAPVLALGMLATKDRKEQLSQLKGQNQALDESMRAKNCALAAAPPPPPPTAQPGRRPPPTTSAQPAAPVVPSKAPKCTDVGGYEAYKSKTGEVCEI